MKKEADKKGPWATFYLADEAFAVNAEDVQEVLLEQPLSPVPLAPKYIVGLLNLRGQVMAAIDLRMRLDFPERAPDVSSSLLVLKNEHGLLSVVVDSIGDVLDFDDTRWEKPPQTLSACHKKFIFGIYPMEGKVVLGLHTPSLEATAEGAEGKET